MRVVHTVNARIRLLVTQREKLFTLARLRLREKYSNSLLGICGAFLSPLLILGAVWFVFSFVFPIEIERFPLFALAGIFPWMFFATAVSEAAFSLVGQKSILGQFSIEYELLPLASLLSNFFNFLIGWVIVYPLFVLAEPRILMLAPFFCILLVLFFFFISGIGILVSTLNVFFRDLGDLLGVLLMFWFWMTPIFYSLDMIAFSLRWIVMINPLSAFMYAFRLILFYTQVPPFWLWLLISVLTLGSIYAGFFIFDKYRKMLLKKV